MKTLPRFPRFAALALAPIVAALAAPAAHAFTIENKDASQYTVPEFNLDDQLRHFRKDGADGSPSGKYQLDGVLGKGTLEFGVQQRPQSNFGPGIGPMFGSSGAGPMRRDFDRVVAPPSSQDFYDR